LIEGIVLALLGVGGLAAYDLTQRRHAILRNFPVIGHLRYLLEEVGPELRQYIVTDNDEERPFSRDQRRWVYASAKGQNNLFGFGTDNDLEHAKSYVVLRHSAFPFHDDVDRDATDWAVPCAKVLGASHGRRHAFRPRSVVNLSAMSFGSLSGPAVQALNRGAAQAGCLHNTGEGSISPHHQHGGELIWQLGTGYFGARTPEGRLDMDMLAEACSRHPVRAIEIKLSQGAKPGKGGVLPGPKVTEEIAAIRRVPVGQTVHSPSYHPMFDDVDGLIELVEAIAERTGLPVGIKSAVGDLDFWRTLARRMKETGRGPDHIQIDGSEGGTGAAPLAFSDHVSIPFKLAFSSVYRIFAEEGVARDVVWIGSGRLGFPEQTMLALAMGVDMVAVAREAMLSIGCIQAQRCHTGGCPTGVATQNAWLSRGIDVPLKAERFARYVRTLRHDVLELTHAAGFAHPSLVPLSRLEILDGQYGSRSADTVFGLPDEAVLPTTEDRSRIEEIMAGGGRLD